jgi:iron complex outermembrane recepter protein
MMNRIAALWGGVALLSIAQPAVAQDQAAARDAQVSEAEASTPLATTRTEDGSIIVTAKRYVPEGAVTANKSDIPLIQTPQSISVVTRDQIDLLAFVDAQQAVRYVSGVFGENYGSDPRYDFITVRGFNPKQYVDGLAVPSTSTINSVGLDLYAFQSLDILKGPSSTLYGNVPPGGLYNMTSRRASSTPGGELQVKYGSDDFKQVAGTVTGPATDWLDVRLTGLYRDRDDTIDYLHAKRLMIAPTATFKIGSSTKITPLAYYQYDDIKGGNGGFLPEIGTLVPNPAGQRISRSINLGDPRNEYIRRQWAVGWDAEQQLGSNLTFRSNTKWSRYRERTYVGLYNGGGYIDASDTVIQQSFFPNAERVRSFATDNRLDGDVSTGALRHKLLVGADYRKVVNIAQFNFVAGPTLNAYAPSYAASVADPGLLPPYVNERLRQTGVYGQDEIALGQLYVTLGGRYDWVKLQDRLTGNQVDPGKFTWRVGANYVTDSGIAPYVSYSTSFEPVLGRDSVTLAPYKPSTGRQWEGGIKYDARGLSPDVKLFATAALFDIVQSNVVTVGANLTPLNGTQAGKVEVWGGELELVARIREQLSINASYSYNHSRVKDSATAIEVGAELPTTPKHKLSAFADYTFARGLLAGFGGGFGGRYTSSSVGALPTSDFLSGALVSPIRANSATLFDAILHYDVPGWRFAVNGSNIFDKRYVARCSSANACYFGASRQILGTVTKRF